MSDRQTAFIAIFLGAILGGATAAVTKIGLAGFPSFSFVFLRFFVASICIVPFVLFKKKTVRNYLSLIPLSLLGTFNILVFIVGIKTTTATIGQLLYAATPFLTSAILYLFYQEKLRKIKALGVIVGFIGTLIVVLLPVIEHGNSFAGDLIGNLLISVGVISWSFYMVYSRQLLKKYSPFDITSAFIFVTTIVSMPFFIFETATHNGWWQNLTLNSILAFFYVAIISTIATYLLNQYAIKHGGAIFASMSFYLLPVFAFLTASILLGERLTIGLAIGGVLVLVGIYFTTKGRRVEAEVKNL